MTTEIYAGLPDKTRKAYIFGTNPNNMEAITHIVFDKLGVDYRFIDSPIRERHIVEARQIAMYITKMKTSLSLKRIGHYFGGRDHSTVIYACQTVRDLMDTNRRFKTIVDGLFEEIDVLL